MRILVGGIMMVLGVCILLVGVWILISPSSFLQVASNLPRSIQEYLIGDIIFGGTSRSWAYIFGGGILLFLGSWLKRK